MNPNALENVVEAILLSTANPMSVKKIVELLTLNDEVSPPNSKDVGKALNDLADNLTNRAVELVEVASGFRIQIRTQYYAEIKGIFEEKPAKYSKALLETLAIITYRQPITRSEIEEIRGVSVSSQIVKNLLERSWIKVVGHKEVPGRPSMYGTTSELLNYFNLKSLDELPTLVEMQDISNLNQELDLDNPN